MIVNHVQFDRFRNLKRGEISFCDGINVIYGENAQGKTNILEAIWLFSGARSFRGAKESEIIAHDSDCAEIKMTFFAEKREQTAEIRFGKDKVDLTGYSYESWHYRFVGREAATYIYENGLCYEEYLTRTNG